MRIVRLLILAIGITSPFNGYSQPREGTLHFSVDSTDLGISRDIKLGSFSLYWKYKKAIHKYYHYEHAPNQIFFSNKNSIAFISLYTLNSRENYVNKIVLEKRNNPLDKEDIIVRSDFSTNFLKISLGDSINKVIDKFKNKKINIEKKELETILTYEDEFKASNSFLDLNYAFYKEELLFHNGKLIQITLSIN